MARRRLRELASDPDVRELQRLLLSNGYTEDGLGVSGLFDKATTTNVSTFQLQHIDQDGNALVADGVVEEKTWWALEHASGDDQRNHLPSTMPVGLTERREHLLALLFEEHAKPVVEDPNGSNRSPDIDGYWGNTGLIGLAWCCAFVSWALHEVLGEYPVDGDHHVGVQNMWRAGQRLGMEMTDPKPGDVFIQIKNDGKGHTGFVVGVSPDDATIYTCEGNCGNRVKLGRRNRSTIHHFLDCLRDGQSTDFGRGDPAAATDVGSDSDR